MRATARVLGIFRWVSWALACGALACQAEAPSAADGDSGASGSSGAGAGSSGAGAGGGSVGGGRGDERCELEHWAKPDQPQLFSSFQARLVEAGKPAAVPTIQVCGFDLCLSGDPVIKGQAKVAAVEPTNILGPAFKAGDGRTQPVLAFRLENQKDVEAGVIEVLSFPLELKGGEVPESGHTVESQGVSLSLREGTTTDFDALAYPTDNDRRFRALVGGPIVHPSFEAADVIVSLAPEGTRVCPPATLEVPKPDGLDWPPGTEVKLLLHGVHLEQEFAPYGGLAEHGVGAVNPTGDRIVFPNAVRFLGTFALRRAR